MRSIARISTDFPPTFRTATLLICHFLGSACVWIYRQIVSDIFSLPEYLLYQTVSADKPLKLVYTLRIIRLPILLICYIDYTYVRYIRSFCFFLWLFLKLRIRSQHMNWTELNWTELEFWTQCFPKSSTASIQRDERYDVRSNVILLRRLDTQKHRRQVANTADCCTRKPK